MAWITLLCAGLLEIGWPVDRKMAQSEGQRLMGVILALAFMFGSGFLLWLAQREISMGTSYAVWTRIRAVGIVLYCFWVYGDPAAATRFLGVSLILANVITLRLTLA
ncbi:quaternary ammonium compound-resistance protein SugE [Pseudoxanthobacter soli DSM 19599]|uniref:Guanidinium exporter n=1 Tax=Pseudoxanthobacter soli DSM 19599 TaxID=1123029 RepID=A0A1M7ZPT1_9HYPH|nr:SMR family transporter [Pseudoxanthobacter soli]SHO66908.1 quaternary ammonium compound-resistance protein SugE [Pseudoxanthobacter soli DSM 19599]